MTERLTTTIKRPTMSLCTGCRVYCFANIENGKVTDIYTNAIVLDYEFIKDFRRRTGVRNSKDVKRVPRLQERARH